MEDFRQLLVWVFNIVGAVDLVHALAQKDAVPHQVTRWYIPTFWVPVLLVNLQYIAMGNIKNDNRVALFFMDDANRQRLKVMARAEIFDASDLPDLIEQLEDRNYRARIERAVVYHVEAFDWNCPQHITPRWTEEELAPVIGELQSRSSELEEENQRLLGVLGQSEAKLVS